MTNNVIQLPQLRTDVKCVNGFDGTCRIYMCSYCTTLFESCTNDASPLDLAYKCTRSHYEVASATGSVEPIDHYFGSDTVVHRIYSPNRDVRNVNRDVLDWQRHLYLVVYGWINEYNQSGEQIIGYIPVDKQPA